MFHPNVLRLLSFLSASCGIWFATISFTASKESILARLFFGITGGVCFTVVVGLLLLFGYWLGLGLGKIIFRRVK